MKILLHLVLMASITSCAATSKDKTDPLEPYLGKHVDEAIAVIGKPSAIYDMQDGTWDYLWTERVSGAGGATALFKGVPLATSDIPDCTRVLTVNSAKLVIRYKYEGKCRRYGH